MESHLFNTDKIRYVKGKNPNVPCILCALRDGHPQVQSLEVVRSGGFIVSVNLFPFNPAHLMLFPERHILSVSEYSDEEALVLHRLTAYFIKLIDGEFSPSGFNVGYNIGKWSGASIEHLHQHIVPRYPNEAGYLDVISGARVVVINPAEARDRLREAVKKSGLPDV